MTELKFIRNYDEDDVIAKILFLYFAFMHGVMGYFIISNDLTNYKSKVFNSMGAIIPMSIWGYVLILSAIFFVLVALQEAKPKYMFMILAGLAGCLVFSLLTMASLELSKNQTNTINYAVVGSIDLLIAIIGGIAIWRRKA